MKRGTLLLRNMDYIGKGERKILEAFEMQCYRKLLKIRWVDQVTNEEVLNLSRVVNTIQKTISLV